MKPKIGFIGAGVTGTAMAVLLCKAGYHVTAVNSRSIYSARRLSSMVAGCSVCINAQQVADAADVVFITTPDDVIENVSNQIEWHKHQVVIHCSGVHSTDILSSAAEFHAYACCMHPLQTFASIDEAINSIAGSTIAVEGEGKGLHVVTKLAESLKGNVIVLKAGDKVLYHAAAVMLSNYLVTLMKLSVDLWQILGVEQEDAIKAMLPLLKGTVNNIERVGIPECLTGPIARGDVATVRKHLLALETSHPDAAEVYRILGIQALPVAASKGRISHQAAEALRTMLEGQSAIQQSYFDDLYKELGFDLDITKLASTADRQR